MGLALEAVTLAVKAAETKGLAGLVKNVVKRTTSKSGAKAAEAAMARAKGYFVHSAQESASVFEVALKGGVGSEHLARPSIMEMITEKGLGFLEALPFMKGRIKPSQLEMMAKVTGKKELADIAKLSKEALGNRAIDFAKTAGEKPGTYVISLAQRAKRGVQDGSKAVLHVDPTGAYPVIKLETEAAAAAAKSSARIDFGALKGATAESIATDFASSVATKGNQVTASLHAGNVAEINLTGDIQKLAEEMDRIAAAMRKLDGGGSFTYAHGTPQDIVSKLETLRSKLAFRLADIKQGLFGTRPSIAQSTGAIAGKIDKEVQASIAKVEKLTGQKITIPGVQA